MKSQTLIYSHPLGDEDEDDDNDDGDGEDDFNINNQAE